VTASCPHPDRRPEVAADGVHLIENNQTAASMGQIVMFAVKPHLTLGVIEEVAPLLKGKLCVSLAAVSFLKILLIDRMLLLSFFLTDADCLNDRGFFLHCFHLFLFHTLSRSRI